MLISYSIDTKEEANAYRASIASRASNFVRPLTSAGFRQNSLHIRDLIHPISNDSIYEYRELAQQYIQKIITNTNWVLDGEALDKPRNPGDESLIEGLLDLTNYKDHQLVTSAFIMLYRIFNSTGDLFSLADAAQLHIVPTSIQLAEKLRTDMPTIRRHGAGFIETTDMHEFNTILRELTQCCYLEEPTVAHRVNQEIINNTEIVSILLDVIKSGNQLAPVMTHVFRFLRAMCVDYPAIQNRLFEELDIILNCTAEGPGWENDMAWLVGEIFNNNQDVCIAIKSNQVGSHILIHIRRDLALAFVVD